MSSSNTCLTKSFPTWNIPEMPHCQENIIQTAQHSTQNTTKPGLSLPLPSHFLLNPTLYPVTCKTPNDQHVQDVMLFHIPGSLIHFFKSGLSFLPITPLTPTPLFTQFSRYSSGQEAILTPLLSQTPIFSSINYTCLHNSCLTLYCSYLLACLSFHLDYKLHEGKHSVMYLFILHIIVCI